MRFSIAVLFAASLASAYTILKRQDDQVPACAQNCFDQSPVDPCQLGDDACLCLNDNFLTALTTCTQTACNAQEVEAATAAGKARCLAAGVDFDDPVPACALACGQNAVSSSTCQEADTACYCNDNTYVQSLSQCTTASCTPEETQKARTVGEALCRANGVDISSAFRA